jgi:glucosamine 6-phosphate synthetase-like amidotransferase/phosphosugar isomerase protein
LAAARASQIALEGALKLKEISYIHAEDYAAGELKHGPIALIDETMPVIVIAPYDRVFDKTVSKMQEVAARGGRLILVTHAEGAEAGSSCRRSGNGGAARLCRARAAHRLSHRCHHGHRRRSAAHLAKSVTVEWTGSTLRLAYRIQQVEASAPRKWRTVTLL